MADLAGLAARLTHGGRGLLTVDQPPAELDEVLRRARIDPTEENRAGLRELVLAAPGLERVVAGVLVDVASPSGAALLARRVVPVGVSTERGGSPGEVDFARRGWVGASASTMFETAGGARQLAEWAADCQRDGVVPLVDCAVRVGERDTLGIATARHTDAIGAVLTALDQAGVDRSATLLGAAMPAPGRRAGDTATSEDVARASINCLRAAGAHGIAGVVFSASGRALAGDLVAMRWLSPAWPIGFRLGADTLLEVARVWRGRPHLVDAGRRELLGRLDATSRTLCAADPSL